MSSVGGVGGAGGMGGAGAVSAGGSSGTVPATQGAVGLGDDCLAGAGGDQGSSGGQPSKDFDLYGSAGCKAQMSTQDFFSLHNNGPCQNSQESMFDCNSGLNLKKLMEWIIAIKMLQAMNKGE